MTNYDAWNLYMRDLPTASLYLEWGFYYTIGAALQRRVWYSSDETAIYPNQYVVFTGTPGTGKSLVTRVIKALLRESKFLSEKRSPDGKTVERMVENYRFPVAADSTTFESLVEEMAEAVSMHMIDERNIYTHHSICFILDELSSIFKVNAQDVNTFLLTTYSCGPYRRRIRNTGGRFTIENSCLSLIAGTVVKELRRLIKNGILDTGMAARTIFVYARRPRFRRARIPARDESQIAARQQLSDYLKRLHKVHGMVKYTPEVEDFLDNWWVEKKKVNLNNDPCLVDYYDRKSITLQRLALAFHYSEQTESNTLELPTMMQALDLLNRTEIDMHVPLAGGRRNELHTIGIDVDEYIGEHPEGVTELELMAQFLPYVNDEELTTILDDLTKLNNIRKVPNNGVITFHASTGLPDRTGVSNQGGQVNDRPALVRVK